MAPPPDSVTLNHSELKTGRRKARLCLGPACAANAVATGIGKLKLCNEDLEYRNASLGS